MRKKNKPDPKNIFISTYRELVPDWVEGVDGTIPYVYANKRPGSRCMWTCRWITSEGGPLDVQYFIDVGKLTEEQKFAELHDYAFQNNPFSLEAARLVLSRHEGKGNMAQVEEVLQKARQALPEHLATWDKNIPKRAHLLRGPAQACRPGWPASKELLDAIEAARRKFKEGAPFADFSMPEIHPAE